MNRKNLILVGIVIVAILFSAGIVYVSPCRLKVDEVIISELIETNTRFDVSDLEYPFVRSCSLLPMNLYRVDSPLVTIVETVQLSDDGRYSVAENSIIEVFYITKKEYVTFDEFKSGIYSEDEL